MSLAGFFFGKKFIPGLRSIWGKWCCMAAKWSGWAWGLTNRTLLLITVTAQGIYRQTRQSWSTSLWVTMCRLSWFFAFEYACILCSDKAKLHYSQLLLYGTLISQSVLLKKWKCITSFSRQGHSVSPTQYNLPQHSCKHTGEWSLSILPNIFLRSLGMCLVSEKTLYHAPSTYK